MSATITMTLCGVLAKEGLRVLNVPAEFQQSWPAAGQGPGSAHDKTQTPWPSPPRGLPRPPPPALTRLTSYPPACHCAFVPSLCRAGLPSCSPDPGRRAVRWARRQPPARLRSRVPGPEAGLSFPGLLATGTESLMTKTMKSPSVAVPGLVLKDQDSQGGPGCRG